MKPRGWKRPRTHLQLVRVGTNDRSDLFSLLEEHECGHGLDADLSSDLLSIQEAESESAEGFPAVWSRNQFPREPTHLLVVDVALEEANVRVLGLELLKDGSDDLAVRGGDDPSSAPSTSFSVLAPGAGVIHLKAYQGPHLYRERAQCQYKRDLEKRGKGKTDQVAQKSMMTSLSEPVTCL